MNVSDYILKSSKARTPKQLENDLRLKEKFLNYHHNKKNENNSNLFETIEEMKQTDTEIQQLLDEPEKKKRGRKPKNLNQVVEIIPEILPEPEILQEQEIIKRSRGRPKKNIF